MKMPQKETPKPTTHRPVIDAETARKVLDRDIINIARQVQDGKPLSPQQRRLIALYAGVLDRAEVLAALYAIHHGACPRCARLITQLITNIEAHDETDTGTQGPVSP